MFKKVKVPNVLQNRKAQFGPIGEQVYKRSYSHILEDGSKETWPETVTRVVDGNIGLVDNIFIKENERETLLEQLFDFSIIPAGRHLNASGAIGRQFLFNCHNSHYSSENPALHFSFLFDQLMQGGGVGANYSNRFINLLPKIGSTLDLHFACRDNHPNIDEFQNEISKHFWLNNEESNSIVIEVEDSREGWVEAVDHVLRLAFSNRHKTQVIIDVSKIRARGEPLKTSGGIACGPGPLVSAIREITDLLNKAYDRKLTSIEVMLLDHALASCVIAGGKRRSSRMAVKHWRDLDIFEFLKCKNVDGKHWTTNISVEIDDEFIECLEDPFLDLSRYTDASKVMDFVVVGMQKNGEPGFWNSSLSKRGERNPEKVCSPNPCQPEFATVLTPTGINTIGNIKIGDIVWSGERWTKVINKVYTGVKPVYSYTTRAGTFVGTENHRIVQNGKKIEVGIAENIDINSGPDIANKSINIQDIMDGLVIGDGSIHKASNNLLILDIGQDDKDYHFSEIKDLIIKNRPGISEYAWEITTGIQHQELPRTFDRKVPDRFKFGGHNKVLGFLRGLYSANGSICGDRVTLKASSLDIIKDVQQMLSSIGITSYYTINKAKNVEFSNGTYECKQSYDLNITTDRRKFHSLIGFIQKYKMQKLTEICEIQSFGKKRSYDICEITSLGSMDVFDITVEAEEHTYWSGGLLVSNCGEISSLHLHENCNLGHVNMARFASKPLSFMLEAFRNCARWLVRATFGDMPQKVQQDIVKDNRRIGVGILGFHEWLAMRGIKYSECHDNQEVRSIMRKCKEAVIEEGTKYAKELGIPVPIKFTTIAPTGTISCLPGTTSGCQALMAPWFKRLVRYSNMDPQLESLKKDGYEVFEDPDAKNTSIVVYWCEDPLVTRVRGAGFVPEEILESQSEIEFETCLKVQAMLQEEFADNGISYTINIPVHKMPYHGEMRYTLTKYLGKLKGTTIFPEMSRKNAPIQVITKQEFDSYQGRKEIMMIEDECKGGCPIR